MFKPFGFKFDFVPSRMTSWSFLSVTVCVVLFALIPFGIFEFSFKRISGLCVLFRLRFSRFVCCLIYACPLPVLQVAAGFSSDSFVILPSRFLFVNKNISSFFILFFDSFAYTTSCMAALIHNTNHDAIKLISGVRISSIRL